jgi:hypothetical protein
VRSKWSDKWTSHRTEYTPVLLPVVNPAANIFLVGMKKLGPSKPDGKKV